MRKDRDRLRRLLRFSFSGFHFDSSFNGLGLSGVWGFWVWIFNRTLDSHFIVYFKDWELIGLAEEEAITLFIVRYNF
jgi:hypothetical protein